MSIDSSGSTKSTFKHSLVKAKTEALNTTFRANQRVVEKEMLHLTSALSQNEVDITTLQQSINRLTTLREKIVSGNVSEKKALDDISNRLEHIRQMEQVEDCDGFTDPVSNSSSNSSSSSSSKRNNSENETNPNPNPSASNESNEDTMSVENDRIINTNVSTENRNESEKFMARLLVDHVARRGYFEVAKKIATAYNIEPLVDINLFEELTEILVDIQEHRCAKALAWCADNRSKLKKLNSYLEFNIRVQEFVELIRKGARIDAIAYSRKYFTQNTEMFIKDMQEVMGLLVYGPGTSCEKYQKYFQADRWQGLRLQFQSEYLNLYCFPQISNLEILLQAGITALKTKFCYNHDTKMSNCPVCTTPMNNLSLQLPILNRTHSYLVCAISKEVMNSDDNQPMMLPNGRVYGLKALGQQSVQLDGYVICPKTFRKWSFDRLEKVFIM